MTWRRPAGSAPRRTRSGFAISVEFAMSDDTFRRLIEQGDLEGVRRALERDSTLANRTIRWHLNQDNESDPLHYVSDCVSQGWLTNGREGELAELLLAHGAAID